MKINELNSRWTTTKFFKELEYRQILKKIWNRYTLTTSAFEDLIHRNQLDAKWYNYIIPNKPQKW